MDNAYAGFLAGPTSIKLTTAWQRFKITGTLAGGQTGLWIFVRQFAGKSRYARTSASPTAFVVAGVACGATVIAAKDNPESPLRIYGLGSNLADHRLLEVAGTGELIIAGRGGKRLPPGGIDGRDQSKQMGSRPQGEEPSRSHGELHPPLLEPVIQSRDCCAAVTTVMVSAVVLPFRRGDGIRGGRAGAAVLVPGRDGEVLGVLRHVFEGTTDRLERASIERLELGVQVAHWLFAAT